MIQALYYWLIYRLGIFARIQQTARGPATAFVATHPLADASIGAWDTALHQAEAEARVQAQTRRADGVRYSHLPDYQHLYTSFFQDWCMLAWREQRKNEA